MGGKRGRKKKMSAPGKSKRRRQRSESPEMDMDKINRKRVLAEEVGSNRRYTTLLIFLESARLNYIATYRAAGRPENAKIPMARGYYSAQREKNQFERTHRGDLGGRVLQPWSDKNDGEGVHYWYESASP